MSKTQRWTPSSHKLGPPKDLKQRLYHPTLELLETEANKQCIKDYEQDIYNYLAIVENNSTLSCAMMDLQPEIQWYMRPYLLDFLVEIHQSFRLHPQTLFLAINIIDKYCSKRVVFKRHYQLVGSTALWLAAKYEDKKSRVPTLKELTMMCRDAYDPEMFVQMEKHILFTLEWSLVHTSLEDCLQISLKNSLEYLQETPKKFGNKYQTKLSLYSKIEKLSRFFCEISLYERNFLQYSNSIISLTCHLLASRILGSESAVESFEISITLYMQSNREIDDDETFDENLENSYPNVIQPFLSGFSEQTIDQINEIGILLIKSFQNCSFALQNKYNKTDQDGLNCINLVKDFISSYSNLIQNFPDLESFNNVKEFELTPELSYSISFILGLTTQPSPNFTTSSSYQHLPPQIQTPPSASSQISSIFSTQDYSSSSINLTPITSSSPMDVNFPHHYQQSSQISTSSTQRGANVFYNNSSQNSSAIFYKKPNGIHDPEYGTFINKRQKNFINYEDGEDHDHIGTDDPSCPGSSPLAQRSQNKLNMVV